MIDLTQKLQIDDLMIAVGTMNKEITQLKADKKFWIGEYEKKDKECKRLESIIEELRVGGTDV